MKITERIDQLTLELTDAPPDNARDFLHEQIKTFNNDRSAAHRAVRQPGAIQPLALFLRNEAGQMVGGLVGDTYWNWLEIDYLWLDDSLRARGLGRELLRRAETEAIMRGCIQAFLTTFSFQARDFYRQAGYQVVGQLVGYPPGETFYWMRKDFGRPETHVSFKSIRSDDDTLAYLAQLNRNHPERPEMIREIKSRLTGLPLDSPQVIELCHGPGMLARHLLDPMPRLRYLGFDFSAAFVAFVRRQLVAFNQRAHFVQADLNAAGWLAELPAEVHAIVSLQSLHDLGDEDNVNRIYRLARQILAPGGLFINADLTTPAGASSPENPGRLSVARHLALLETAGFRQVTCSLEVADFACIIGYAP